MGRKICGECQRRVKDALAKYERYLEQMLEDHCLIPEEEHRLTQFQRQLGLTDEDLAPIKPKLERARMLSAIIMGNLPVVEVPLILKQGEVCHFAAPATLLEERTRREYVSGSRGVSIRIAKGVYYRIGATKGYSVPVREIVPVDNGTFYITNQRCLFVGNSKTLSVPHRKLVSYEAYQDGLQLHYEGRRRSQYFKLDDGELAAVILWSVMQREI